MKKRSSPAKKASIDQLDAQFAWQREDHVLGLSVEFAHAIGPEFAQAVDDAPDQDFWRGRAGTDADMPSSLQPRRIDFTGAVDQVRLDPFPLGEFAQTIGVGAVGRP